MQEHETNVCSVGYPANGNCHDGCEDVWWDGEEVGGCGSVSEGFDNGG